MDICNESESVDIPAHQRRVDWAANHAARVGCWCFVLRKRFREKHSKALKSFYRSSKDHQEMFEASGFAAMLVGAIFFTIFFVAFLVMLIVDWL